MMTLLNICEVAKYMRCSVNTIRRRIADARKGESTFPLPIHGSRKRGLWRQEDIELWSEAPPPDAHCIESPTVRNRRLENTRKQLRKLGLKFGDTEAG